MFLIPSFDLNWLIDSMIVDQVCFSMNYLIFSLAVRSVNAHWILSNSVKCDKIYDLQPVRSFSYISLPYFQAEILSQRLTEANEISH